MAITSAASTPSRRAMMKDATIRLVETQLQVAIVRKKAGKGQVASSEFGKPQHRDTKTPRQRKKVLVSCGFLLVPTHAHSGQGMSSFGSSGRLTTPPVAKAL